MIHKKLAHLYRKNTRIALIATAVFVLTAFGSVAGAWAIKMYWFPPLLRFSEEDIAQTVSIHTSIGKFVIQMDKKNILPSAQFTRLVAGGLYDGTRIHRIVPDLLIELGDPLTRDTSLRHFWGEGGVSAVFKNETHKTDVMSEGTVALTGSGAGTYGSQFFVLTRDTPWMKGKHTIIGHVVSGMDVVHAIEHMPHLATGLPTEDILITSVTINE